MACKCGYRKKLLEKKDSYNFKKSVYLDYNATTPVDIRVLRVYEKMCREYWANPSSVHSAGIKVWREIQKSREILSKYFSWSENGIYFCSSGTEAINKFLSGYLLKNMNTQIISTKNEHSAVLHLLRILKMANTGGKIDKAKSPILLDVNNKGRINIDNLSKILQNSIKVNNEIKTLIVYSPVNHETGIIQDVEAIYSVANKYNSVVFLDGVQAAARLNPELWTSYCHGFALSGHKIYAPKGSGALFVEPGLRISKTSFGGFQESGVFPGTENAPGIAALGEAVRLLNLNEENRLLSSLIKDFLHLLKKNAISYVINSTEDSVPGVLSISFPEILDMEDFFSYFYNHDICVSRFSACSGRIKGPSKILENMGVKSDLSSSSLRISIGRFSKREDLNTFVFALGNFLKNK